MLAEQLRRQEKWDAEKRDILLENLKVDRLKHKLEAGGHAAVRAVGVQQITRMSTADDKAYLG